MTKIDKMKEYFTSKKNELCSAMYYCRITWIRKKIESVDICFMRHMCMDNDNLYIAKGFEPIPWKKIKKLEISVSEFKD